jgi:RimJ/RimL family protein N-acetyltransferase
MMERPNHSQNDAVDLPINRELTTQRLRLRPLLPSDAASMWPDMADPEISRWMAWDAHGEPQQTDAFIAHEQARREAGRGITFAVLEKDRFCGIVSLIGLMRTHRALTYDRAELAYWLGRAHRGRGLATEAGAAVLRFAFGPLALHKVHVGHFGVNAASRALIQRLGFRHVGIQRQEFCKDGVWHDHHLYEMLNEEFAAREQDR